MPVAGDSPSLRLRPVPTCCSPFADDRHGLRSHGKVANQWMRGTSNDTPVKGYIVMRAPTLVPGTGTTTHLVLNDFGALGSSDVNITIRSEEEDALEESQVQ
jgi:hypothetical protein